MLKMTLIQIFFAETRTLASMTLKMMQIAMSFVAMLNLVNMMLKMTLIQILFAETRTLASMTLKMM
jgi:hypothetical protein